MEEERLTEVRGMRVWVKAKETLIALVILAEEDVTQGSGFLGEQLRVTVFGLRVASGGLSGTDAS